VSVDEVCQHVYDQVDRNVVEFTQREGDLSLEDVAGTITLHSPHPARSRLGREPKNVTLAVENGKP